MGKKRQKKEPVIPNQDKRICGGICLCQFTIVTSCVALVYLAVAVYMPSYRAFTYGLEPIPVMCQATNSSLVNNCMWTSCGEWCLTKSSGLCNQIHVTVRRNGTTITLEECNKLQMVSCPMVKLFYLIFFILNNYNGLLMILQTCLVLSLPHVHFYNHQSISTFLHVFFHLILHSSFF
ncbi:hypothetical protein O3M35_000453 [Rhynocoris fuscipes]|uniref:Uncharacterized protein n=1 Tax=Rhynocoris fuscipes TaxID=488301 RepID=A0AAW1DNS2_9HEMI